MRKSVVVGVVLATMVGAMVGWTVAAQQAATTSVLFMCPHGAAKSVLASAYFQRAAKERGLNVHVVSAGTDPDARVSATVASHLEKNGYELPVSTPRRVSAADIEKADIVVSIGCDPRDLPSPTHTLLKWDDVPSTTEDFSGADATIRQRVLELVDELVRKHRH
jgi:arsenate reductase